MANRYIFHSRISEAKFRHLVRLFALDLNAVQIAALTRISRVSINHHLAALRRHMAWHCDQVQPMRGDSEVDESYFGARRVRGKCGRGAFGKTTVFGLFNRHGQVVYRNRAGLSESHAASHYPRASELGQCAVLGRLARL